MLHRGEPLERYGIRAADAMVLTVDAWRRERDAARGGVVDFGAGFAPWLVVFEYFHLMETNHAAHRRAEPPAATARGLPRATTSAHERPARAVAGRACASRSCACGRGGAGDARPIAARPTSSDERAQKSEPKKCARSAAATASSSGERAWRASCSAIAG